MNEEMEKAAELKQVELMMHGCEAGKKVMKFLKDEGYKIQSGFAYPDKASIDPEKKTISLDTGSIVMHNEYAKGERAVDYAPAARERCALSLIEAACTVKQKKYNADFFKSDFETVRDVREGDVIAAKCLFVSQMKDKNPKLAEVLNGQHTTAYGHFQDALNKTGNENAACSAVVDNCTKKPEASVQDCKKHCTDFDGKSYYVEKDAAVNVAAMAKAKQQGR